MGGLMRPPEGRVNIVTLFVSVYQRRASAVSKTHGQSLPSDPQVSPTASRACGMAPTGVSRPTVSPQNTPCAHQRAGWP